jgi:hypothetical protein
VTRTERAAWAAHHRRGDVLRAVVDHADRHRDGLLPTHLPGVAETFRDETDLVAALQLRWHTRLAGAVERSLAEQPTDLEAAVVTAWRATATELAGVRMILDRAADAPATDELAGALDRAAAKEHTLLAVMAGRAAMDDAAAPAVGRTLEERARSGLPPAPAPARTRRSHRADGRAGGDGATRSLVGRLKAVLAA